MSEINSNPLGTRITRRGLGIAALVGSALGLTARPGEAREDREDQGSGSVPTPETPDGNTVIPPLGSDGVRRITLTAEPVNRVLLEAGGKQVVAQAYGLNGSTPGPTLVFYEGDRVAITVVNRLPEPTAIHWHGVIVPNSQDGVPEVGEPTPLIPPGGSYTYQYQIVQPAGTHMYHSHVDIKSEMLGVVGGFVILPRHGRSSYPYDRDFLIWLHSWSMPQDLMGMALKDRPYTGSPVDTVNSVTAEPNWFSDMFNFFTMNAKAYPSTTPLQVSLGQKVRVRFINIGRFSHPIHLHGQNFFHIAEDGVNLKQPRELNTIEVAPGKTQDILFEAQNPGVWPFHCHISHHQANNFSSGFGGMATVVQIS